MQPSITTIKPQDCTTVAKYHSKLTSPLIIDDNIYCVAQNGDILKYNQIGEVEILFTLLGQPSSITYRDTEEYFIVSDFAHQSIFARQDTKNQQIHNLISQYNNRAFLGPNTIKIGSLSRNLYFTDSGPFLETSLENKQGSVFVYSFQNQSVNAMTFRTLAYPSGLECDQQEKFLIVSQTGLNRLLKFYLNENGISENYTVFYQFSGRMGPTAISRFQSSFYVALFEFEDISSNGSIAVINTLGEITEKFYIPTGPQITGLFINESLMLNNICSSIYVSQGNQIHKVILKPQESKMGDSIMKHH